MNNHSKPTKPTYITTTPTQQGLLLPTSHKHLSYQQTLPVRPIHRLAQTQIDYRKQYGLCFPSDVKFTQNDDFSKTSIVTFQEKNSIVYSNK